MDNVQKQDGFTHAPSSRTFRSYIQGRFHWRTGKARDLLTSYGTFNEVSSIISNDYFISSFSFNRNKKRYTNIFILIFYVSVSLIPYSYRVEIFIFLWIFTKSVELLGRVIGPSQGLYLNTE
jgi:hypothetical protein